MLSTVMLPEMLIFSDQAFFIYFNRKQRNELRRSEVRPAVFVLSRRALFSFGLKPLFFPPAFIPRSLSAGSRAEDVPGSAHSSLAPMREMHRACSPAVGSRAEDVSGSAHSSLAPMREMHRAALARPRSAQAARSSPRSRPARNPATKLSPAPVESTTFTGRAGRWKRPSSPFT